MTDYNENFAVKNISLTNLAKVNLVQVGYDTDGNFADPFEEGQPFRTLTRLLGSTEAFYQGTNPEEGGISNINIIKLCNQDLVTGIVTVLAYRALGYTVDVIPSDDAKISVHVTLFTDTIGEQTGDIKLNYLEHTKQLPQEVHSNIENLPFQEIDTISSANFPSIIELHTSGGGVADFDPSSNGLQKAYGTPVYYSGEGKTYSNLLWYYWNPAKINDFLTALAAKFAGTLASYVLSLIDKISTQKPMLGFNARYGSYLYWYNISTDYLCVIYVGSNHYNAIDIFITENTENITPHDCVFWNEEAKQFRIKMNRWYNHLYFIADNKAYQINTNLDAADNISIYSEDIEEPFSYNSSIFGDVLKYSIRAFRPDITNAIQIKAFPQYNPTLVPTNNVKYWQLEFADIGDILCFSYEQNGESKIAIYNILDQFLNAISDGMYQWTLDEPIDATRLGENDPNYPLFNQYIIDDVAASPRLWGLYQTTLVHLQYFLKNDYTPLYLGEEYSIGLSNIYHNYLTLFKTPTKANRRRCNGHWLEGTGYIEQGKIGRLGNIVEDIYTGNVSSDNNLPLAAERGVLVKGNNSGAYRMIGPVLIPTVVDFTYWSYSTFPLPSSATEYDTTLYHYFADVTDYTKLSLRFIDANQEETIFSCFDLSISPYNDYIFKFNVPAEGVYTVMQLEVAHNPQYLDVRLYFEIAVDFRTNYPTSSEFASKFFDAGTCQLKEGCSIAVLIAP